MADLPHSNVYKDPLTPVVMLERTLRVFPKRVAVIHGELSWTNLALPPSWKADACWPVPAIVRTLFSARSTSRIAWFFVSATYSRSPSRAVP